MAHATELSSFEAGTYLEERMKNPSFVMVEIGHGKYPLVDQQPGGFHNQQAYIGIEAGLRYRDELETRAQKLQQSHRDMNAFFLTHYVGDAGIYTHSASSEDWHEGDYDPVTILPDEAADEVVASNVFCDPLIARSFGRTNKLLTEMSRLITKGGMVILRETITPGEVTCLQPYVLKQAGLEAVKRVTPASGIDWEELELFYGTHKEWTRSSNPYPESYYLFLAKTAAGDTTAS